MRALVLLAIMLCLAASPALAAPWLVCDPQAGVTSYQVTGASWVTTRVPAEPDGSLRLSVAPAPVGSTPLQVSACNQWECSPAAPFALARPLVPSRPVGVRLMP